MAAIKLVIELVSSDSDFVCIDDDHVAAHVHGRAIAWLIFASACTSKLLSTTHMFLVSTRSVRGKKSESERVPIQILNRLGSAVRRNHA